MNKRRYRQWLVLWALVAWPALASAQTSCTPTPHYQPINERAPKALLYSIRRCGQPESYIFGTFHSDAPSLGALYQLAIRHLQGTKQLVLEVVLSDEESKTVRAMLLAPQRAPNLSEQLSKEQAEAMSSKLLPRIGISEQEAQRYKPWAIAMMAQYPPSQDDGVVLDEKLQHYASKWGIAVKSLETPQEQLGIFDRMSQPMQLDFLRSTIDDADVLDAQQEEIESYYVQQDAWAILTMSDRVFGELATHYPNLAAYIQDRVLTRRNHAMATRMLPLLKTSGFIAIGALHLPGKDGVLSLLENRGYEIWPIDSAPLTDEASPSL